MARTLKRKIGKRKTVRRGRKNRRITRKKDIGGRQNNFLRSKQLTPAEKDLISKFKYDEKIKLNQKLKNQKKPEQTIANEIVENSDENSDVSSDGNSNGSGAATSIVSGTVSDDDHDGSGDEL
jgi:hypothetical protein